MTIFNIVLFGMAISMLSACGGQDSGIAISNSTNRASGNNSVSLDSIGLPKVDSGVLPGPKFLYERLPIVPELSNSPPFNAEPLLISGTDAYREGEYLYQDFLFDDRGADTALLVERFSNRTSGVGSMGSDPVGDVLYPTDQIYGNNGADLVEFRMKPVTDAILYRVTLTTLKKEDSAIVGIGIDTDKSDRVIRAWPNQAGISSEGLDYFISAWGNGGEILNFKTGEKTILGTDEISTDLESNQMTISVPLSIMNPRGSTWRYVAGVGLHNKKGEWMSPLVSSSPTLDRPVSGSGLKSAPAVFNLGFRFNEIYDILRPGSLEIQEGNWSEAAQARTLSQLSSGPMFADVDFTKLEKKVNEWIHSPGRDQIRIMPTGFDIPEGKLAPEMQDLIVNTYIYGGRLQTYMLRIPESVGRGGKPGLTLALHGANQTHTFLLTGSPNYLKQIGDDRDHYILSPLKRTSCCFQPEWYVDIFEAWRDVVNRFPVDSERVTISGYSAGGYDTYRLSMEYPDLFGSAFPIVAASLPGVPSFIPGNDQNYQPMTGNARWIPFVAWNQVTDEAAPTPGPQYTQLKFMELGLRIQQWAFLIGEHNQPALADQWGAVIEHIGQGTVTRDPHRVDFTITPSTWSEKYGLIPNHAYWVSDMQMRDNTLRDATQAARGSISAVSAAFGKGDVSTVPLAFVHSGLPGPAVVTGLSWAGIGNSVPENKLNIRAQNLKYATVDMKRAKLSCDAQINVQTDGPFTLKLAGCDLVKTYQ